MVADLGSPRWWFRIGFSKLRDRGDPRRDVQWFSLDCFCRGRVIQTVKEAKKVEWEGRRAGAKTFHIAGVFNVESGSQKTGGDDVEEVNEICGPPCWHGCDPDHGGFKKLEGLRLQSVVIGSRVCCLRGGGRRLERGELRVRHCPRGISRCHGWFQRGPAEPGARVGRTVRRPEGHTMQRERPNMFKIKSRYRERCRCLSAVCGKAEQDLNESLGRVGQFIRDTAGATHALSCGTTDRDCNQVKCLQEALDEI